MNTKAVMNMKTVLTVALAALLVYYLDQKLNISGMFAGAGAAA